MLRVMNMKDTIEREKYIVVHGQTARFRVIKYLLLAAFLIPFWLWQGDRALAILLVCLTVISVTIHLLFRWKTKAWTQSWGPYKKMALPK